MAVDHGDFLLIYFCLLSQRPIRAEQISPALTHQRLTCDSDSFVADFFHTFYLENQCNVCAGPLSVAHRCMWLMLSASCVSKSKFHDETEITYFLFRCCCVFY